MTLTEIKKLCEVWQKRLRVQDWDIELNLVNGFKLEGNLGRSRTFPNSRRATIDILNPSDNPHIGKEAIRKDTEDTLIHELLHVALRDADYKNVLGEERFITAMAKLLLEANFENND